ncbi:hypothetical protein LTR91_010916 [Friedmanniomyces endolithicus]|uniref:Uncharacterized protein n=1 Tax=Friedmanniomyces endolithicus TaxID=329885 RepID=A0AAN6KIL9_9PEZI|nr:hypothetical protein LTR57_003734 [Friedmanniomyces endolithicus]KAK0984372.1 hypothetical protein LTR91_010916 [Friedmanniomyces endolithicus]KAK0997508.1 hypothetical protein LTS01_006018 [Friedmanniomyces endolithicus]KAK1047209.1 hypothetical protein LTS16_005293 [Friedmanniomyces endolithicus]
MGKLWGTHRKKSRSSGLLDWNTFDQGIIPTSYFPHDTPLLGSAAGYSGWPGNPGEMVLQQQQQQETYYEPSQSLRDLITSRLIQQQKCLKHEQKRLATMVETSCEAKRVSDAGRKGPGDQQISAASVQQATVGATLGYQDPMMMSRNPLGMPRAYNDPSNMTRAYAAMGTPFSPFAGYGGEIGVEPPVQAGKKSSKTKDSMIRYTQLQAEIDALALLYQPSEADMLGLQAAMLSTDRNMTVKLLLAAPVVDEESDSESNSEEGEQESDSEDVDSSRAVTQRTREAQAPRGNMPQPSGSAAPSPQPGQPSWGFGSPGAGGHMQQPNLGNAPPTQHRQPAQMGGQMLQQPMGAPPGN